MGSGETELKPILNKQPGSVSKLFYILSIHKNGQEFIGKSF